MRVVIECCLYYLRLQEYLTKLATECKIDLVIGLGESPCQDLTRMAGPARQGLKGEKSR